jgi:hypothetical protein
MDCGGGGAIFATSRPGHSYVSAMNAAPAQSKSFEDKEGYVHLKLLPESSGKIWQYFRRS